MEKTAFVFPGQGTQFIGMGKSFYDNFPIARQTYEEASDAAHVDISKLCFQGGISQQSDFTNMQLIVVTTSVAMFRSFYESFPVLPQFFAGHSVGEYAAYICSGAIELQDGIRLLNKRGELLQRVIDKKVGYMDVIENLTMERLRECLEKEQFNQISIACENSFHQNMISGPNEELEKAEKCLRNLGARCTPLLQSPPIHSLLIDDEIVSEYRTYLESFHFHQIHIPVISNLNGKCNSDEKMLPFLLSQQLNHTVKWNQITQEIDKYGVTICIEMGPKILLKKFDLENMRNYHTYCYGAEEERTQLNQIFEENESLKRDRVDFFGRSLCTAVTSKNNNFDNKQYKKEVLDNYNKLLSYEGKELNNEDKRMIVSILKDLLDGKKLDQQEQKEYFYRLLVETGTYYSLAEWYQHTFELK